MPAPAAARELRRDPRAGVVAARPRARRAGAARLGAVVRRRGAAARHRRPDRPPRVAELHRGLARRAGRRLPGGRLPAVLCYGATERNGGRDEARRGLAECRRFVETTAAAGPRRGRAARLVHGLRRHDPRGRGAVPRSGHRPARARGRRRGRRRRRQAARLRRAARAAASASARCRRARSSRTACTSAKRGAARRRARLWLVQNPRSNPGNRVGYPAALAPARASRSAPTAIRRTWRPNTARCSRNPRSTATTPPPWRGGRMAGHALLAERFGGRTPVAAAAATASNSQPRRTARAGRGRGPAAVGAHGPTRS